MIEVVIHGRGGGGGVTLAKLIAGAYFLRDKYVQAFGVYGAERSGAPVQAFVRVDDEDITLVGPVTHPDHVIIIDSSLISSEKASGIKRDGWVILNSPEEPAAFVSLFPGCRIATVDASAIAVANCLGSATLPIVNTTMLGAVVRSLELDFTDAEAALATANLGGPNLAAARSAYDDVHVLAAPGSMREAAVHPVAPALGFLDEAAGDPPIIHTGEWASQRPTGRTLAALCNDACPAGNDVRGFLQAAARQDHTSALATILETSPFPGVCGRVCPAPCMQACNRALLDEPVNVRDVERAVAERGIWPEAGRPMRSEAVAIVGSGPAGLSAAYQLARDGYAVTVFEAEEEIGGLLRSGIPAYRLPRQVLDREIDHILRYGVAVKTGHAVDRRELVDLSREFAAVFVATGQKVVGDLDLDDSRHGTVAQGLDFLDRARRSDLTLRGDSVVVAGGGNTALDAARCALRLGADDVCVVYRRSRDEMPAISDEIDEGLEEGVQLIELVTPLGFRRGEDGPELLCRRMRLGEPDESGRRRPVPLDGDEALVSTRCDQLLLALGQSSDLSILPEGVQPGEDGRVDMGMRRALVLAGGDFLTGEGTIAAAIGSGRAAAEAIAAALAGVEREAPQAIPLATSDVVSVDRFPRSPQRKTAFAPANERRTSFVEVRRGLVGRDGEDAVSAEAGRCLSCGCCNACETCVGYCPEGVLRCIGEHECSFDYDYCKGCGLCAVQCPRGAIVMESGSEAVKA